MNKEQEYYSSHNKLPFIGTKGQERMRQSKVLVIGAGGLGCPCLLALAGAGVGTIGIADFDYVAVSNLHRQNLYLPIDAGKKKAVVAEERLSQYNPFVNIVVHDMYVNHQNIIALLKDNDIVVDCTDNFVARYLINDACVYLNKPLVYGAIHRAEGQVTVFNYNDSATLRCLFPKDDNDTTQSCADIGAYNIVTGIIGLMMANEVIKIVTEQKDVLANTLLSIDSLAGSILKFQYHLNAGNLEKSTQRFSQKIAVQVK
jgi:sulfur-carrier protein adenylyltransferase/sulfurtransferase